MTTYHKEQPETIQKMFATIARRYDRTNAVLSFNMHKRWNHLLAKSIGSPQILADLCCGTGEIAFSYLKQYKQPAQVFLIDFCDEMLQCSKEKAKKLPFENHRFTYIQADVQAIPLDDQSVTGATMAYGIRNVKNPLKAIQEAYRILKPQGRFAILELTRPTSPFLRFGHSIYLRTLLPILGKWTSHNQEAYEYLCNSIHHFVEPSKIELMMQEAGFTHTAIRPLHGGIATIISGQR